MPATIQASALATLRDMLLLNLLSGELCVPEAMRQTETVASATPRSIRSGATLR